MEYLIKNGYVYDPLNNVKGEKMDIAVKDGKIVSSVELRKDVKVIDASGMVVMPGGIDIHSHIAGPKVSAGRIMRPEDHYKVYMRMILGVRRSGTGRTTPSTNLIGYKYARMGWTTVFEPATPPLETRHTHEELDDIPVLDKGCFPLLDSNWFVLDYLQNKEYEKCATFVGWIMDSVKGYAIKIVDPGVAEAWSLGIGVGLYLDDQIPNYNLTPREIIRGLCKVNQMLKLPHPIHVHCNRLGFPGNYTCTLDTINAVSDLGLTQDQPIIHITHVQFTGYAGDSWATLASGGEEIAKCVNNNRHVSLDLGQIVFGDATTMTADAPFEFVLHHLAPGRWTSTDVEAEAAAGIVPFRYRKKNFVNTVQWCIGLEIALLVKDPWRIFPTTDHPNAGPFTRYPIVLSWLMSRKAREKMYEQVNRRGLRKTALPAIDREYDLYEIAIITRAAGARILGLKSKGHLGIGADADIAIYNLNPEKFDPSKDWEAFVRAFRRAAYTLKNGEVVVKNGEVLRHMYGETYYVKPKIPEDLLKTVVEDVKVKFKDWYSISFENYIISDNELRRVKPIHVETALK